MLCLIYSFPVCLPLMNNTQLFQIETSWQHALEDTLGHPALASLVAFVERERASGVAVYPPAELVFNAFAQTPFDKVKVVIVGQDPYHGPGQAHGLCFSVPEGIPLPPSLMNVYKELEADLGIPPAKHGCLLSWAKQGVLLLNATLTVRQGEPNSHQGKGWDLLTDAAIEALVKRPDPVIFVLWGKFAQEKCRKVPPESHHKILIAAHPSPFSAHSGFFGCRHFSQINELLGQMGKAPIEWRLS